jgi:hypothetical protein
MKLSSITVEKAKIPCWYSMASSCISSQGQCLKISMSLKQSSPGSDKYVRLHGFDNRM